MKNKYFNADNASQKDLLQGMIPKSIEGKQFYNLQYAGIACLIVAVVSRMYYPILFIPSLIGSGAIIMTYQVLRFYFTPKKKLSHVLWLLGFGMTASYFVLSFAHYSGITTLIAAGATLLVSSYFFGLIQSRRKPKADGGGSV